MTHEKALEAAQRHFNSARPLYGNGEAMDAAISAYLAAYGVRDLGALVESARECANGHGCDSPWADDAEAVYAALTAPSPR